MVAVSPTEKPVERNEVTAIPSIRARSKIATVIIVSLGSSGSRRTIHDPGKISSSRSANVNSPPSELCCILLMQPPASWGNVRFMRGHAGEG